MPTFYERVDAELDIDPSEYWDQCSDREKQKLAEYAIDDEYASGYTGRLDRNSQTYTEQCLSVLLDEIWENRIHVDMKTIDRFRAQLKAERIL